MHLHSAVVIPSEALSEAEPVRNKCYTEHVVFQLRALIDRRSDRVEPAPLCEEAAYVAQVFQRLYEAGHDVCKEEMSEPHKSERRYENVPEC